MSRRPGRKSAGMLVLVRAFRLLLAVTPAGLLASCGAQRVEALVPEVLGTRPHDPGAFTQGLELHGGLLYESTGLVGFSSLREVDPVSGAVIRQRAIPSPYFAEGLTLVGDELVQITFQNGIAFRWDRATFEPTGQHSYSGEGWGLCYDGSQLWMTDGSAKLFRRDPATFDLLGSVTVTLEDRELLRLNELECVQGVIYANIWLTDRIVRIDPASGKVTAVIDAANLRAALGPGLIPDAVLNGIAYDAANGTFLVTGKLWPTVFEVRFVPGG